MFIPLMISYRIIFIQVPVKVVFYPLAVSESCKQEMHKHLNNVILNISSMQMKGE